MVNSMYFIFLLTICPIFGYRLDTIPVLIEHNIYRIWRMTLLRSFVIVLAIFKFNHLHPIRKNHYRAPSAPFLSSSATTCKTPISSHGANDLSVHYCSKV